MKSDKFKSIKTETTSKINEGIFPEYEREEKERFDFIKKNTWLKSYWKKQEQLYSQYIQNVNLLEKKMKKEAKLHKIKEIKFAWLEDVFGIDIGDVDTQRENHNDGRWLIHDTDFMMLNWDKKNKKRGK